MAQPASSGAAAAVAAAAPAPVAVPAAVSAGTYVTEIAITTSMAGPDDFERCAKVAAPAYVWIKRGSGDPVMEVKVVHGEEAAGADWVKTPENIGKANGTAVYLCYKRGGDSGSPLLDIKAISDNDALLEGYSKIEREVNPGDAVRVFFYAKTKATAEKKPREFQVGDFVDVLDTVNKWCVGRVVDKNETDILIHYEGWSDKWNEWMTIKGQKRLAPFRTYTKGRDTGPDSNDKAFFLRDDNLRQFQAFLNTFQTVVAVPDGQRTEEHNTFLSLEVPKWVFNVMNAVIDDPELLPVAAKFLQSVLALTVRYVKALPEVPQAIAESLYRILDADVRTKRFYTKYGMLINDKQPLKELSFARRTITGRDDQNREVASSVYLVENVQFFAEQGGFTAIAERLSDSTRPTSFHIARLFVSAIAAVNKVLQPAYLASWLPQISNTVTSRIRQITDDELKTLDRESLSETVRQLELLQLTASLDARGQSSPAVAAQLAEFVEKLSLDIALRLLTCKLLEKRINGVAELRDWIERIRRREYPQSFPVVHQHHYNRVQLPEPSRFLTSQFLAAWMEENKVVDVLLGASSHHEIVKRSPPLLKFLAANQALSTDHLDVLWTSSIGKHEAIVRVVYDTIADLASDLSSKHLDFLFTRIQAIPLPEYRDLTINFLKAFTVNAVKNSNLQLQLLQRAAADNSKEKPAYAAALQARRWYGLEVFWRLVQDSVELSDDVAQLALTTLQDLLASEQFEAQRLPYLEKCIINIREGQSVAQALKLLQHIIESLTPGVRGNPDVQELDKKFGLMALLMKDLSVYNSQATKAKTESLRSTAVTTAGPASAPAAGASIDDAKREAPLTPRGEAVASAALDAKLKIGRYTHAEHLEVRMGFLDFVLTRSMLMLTKDHIDTLWDVLVVKGISPTDRIRCFRWLNDALEKGYGPRDRLPFVDDVILKIFTDLLTNPAKLDFAQLSRRGFRCYQTYFLYINGQILQALDNSVQYKRRRLTILKFHKLLGLDALWAIAAQAAEPDVVVHAAHLLTAVHTRLDGGKKKEVLKGFVDRAVALLGDAHKVLVSSSSSAEQQQQSRRVVLQVVSLLENFLYRIEETLNLAEDDWLALQLVQSKNVSHLVVAVHETVRDPAPTKITVTVTIDHKIGSLRRELARHLKVAPEQLHFVYKNRSLYADEYDHLSLFEARVRGIADVISCYKVSADQSLVRPADDPKAPESGPRLQLSNDKACFELFFDLLKLGGRIGQDVWRLLSRLPTNGELAGSIRSVANASDQSPEPDWGRLLQTERDGTPTSLLKMFYALQIVERLLTYKDTDSQQRKQEADNWAIAFVKKGGLMHVVRALLKVDVEIAFADILPQSCVASLLRLVEWFLVGGYHRVTKAVGEPAVAYDQLVQRVLLIISKTTAEAPGVTTVNSTAVITVTPSNGAAGVILQGAGASPASSDEHAADASEISATLCSLLAESWFLLGAAAARQPALLTAMYNYPRFLDILFQGLVVTHDVSVRMTIRQGLLALATRFDPPRVTPAADGAAVVAPSPVAPTKLADPSLAVPPRARLLELLLQCLPRINTESSNCNEYFDLISHLLAGLDMTNAANERLLDTRELSRDLANKIKRHTIVETRYSEEGRGDTVLRGLLNLTRELVHQVPAIKDPLGQEHGLVLEVFRNCLFDVPTAKRRGVAPPPKCKTTESRRAAFALLGELAKGSDANFKQLVQLLTGLHGSTHSNGLRPFDWDFEAKAEEKSDTGFVGLKNLGCICYMNSLMQQLFMVPPLRRNLLSAADKEENKADSVLYQLQYIFSFLQESDKMYCDPAGFCLAFKDYDGQPTNVHVQMDAQEFLNMLFDRVDTKLKGSPDENCLKNVLGGVFSNELICKGCPHYKERSEDFYAISVNVKNKKSLQESLESFVQGEMLEGDNAYLCGVCNKKVDTLKRTCLKTLPNTAIFHLKRFEFNFDTMQKVKLNDRFEFPRKLNLKPYTREGLAAKEKQQPAGDDADGDAQKRTAEGKDNDDGLEPLPNHPDDYYEYELSGVLVHTGSADRGHYYSYIKERLPEDERLAGKAAQWFEFNDALVRPFDIELLEEETFGGEEARPRSYQDLGMGAMGPRNNQQGATVMQEKYRNAYLLFYDRVKPVKAAVPTVAVAEQASAVLTSAQDQKQVAVSAPKAEQLPAVTTLPQLGRSNSLTAPVPPEIFNSIWEQNTTYWRDKNVFDPVYFDFLREIYSCVRPDPDAGASDIQALAASGGRPPVPAQGDVLHMLCELTTRFVFETLSRYIHKQTFPDWMRMLRALYKASPASCVWLVQSLNAECPWTYDFLLGCPHETVRKEVSALFCYALTVVSRLEHSRLPELSQLVTLRSQKQWDAMPLVIRYGTKLTGYLNRVPENWKRFPQLFRVVHHVAQLSALHSQYLLTTNLVSRLIDLFLADESPHPEVGDIPVNKEGRRRRMNDEWGNVPDWSTMVQLLGHLVCSALPPSAVPPFPPTLLTDGSAPPAPMLSAVDMQMLLCPPFLARLLQMAITRKSGTAVGLVLRHLCWNNAEVTQKILASLSIGMEENGDDETRSYLRVLMTLVCLPDSLQERRVADVLTALLNIMKMQNVYWRFTTLCIEHLIRMAKKSEHVYAWLNRNYNRWNWCIEYIDQFPKPPQYGDRVQMSRPSRQQSAYDRERYYGPPNGLTPKARILALEAIRERRPLDSEDASDSDEDLSERVFEMGQWVDCRDTVAKPCEAQIVDQREDEVRVHYDGWSEKWDEWMDRSSARITRYGRWTSEIPRERLKGRGPQPGDNLGNGRRMPSPAAAGAVAGLQPQALQQQRQQGQEGAGSSPRAPGGAA